MGILDSITLFAKMFLSHSFTILVTLTAHVPHVVGYSIPQHAVLPLARALAIDVTRNGFTYGPSVGGGPFYPAGLLGLAKDAVDVAAEGIESAAELALTTADEVVAAAAGNGKVSTIFLCSQNSS